MGNYKEVSKSEIEKKLSEMSLEQRQKFYRDLLKSVKWEIPIKKDKKSA